MLIIEAPIGRLGQKCAIHAKKNGYLGQKSFFCLGIAIFVNRTYHQYTRGYNFPIWTDPKKFPFRRYGSFWAILGQKPVKKKKSAKRLTFIMGTFLFAELCLVVARAWLESKLSWIKNKETRPWGLRSMWWNLAKIILTPFPQPQIAAKQSLDGLEKPKNIHFHFFEKFPHDHVNSVSFYHTLSLYWEDITKPWKIQLWNGRKISTSRIKLIWKRNTTATNATTRLLRPAAWNGTSWFIVVRSHWRAHNANILAQQLTT